MTENNKRMTREQLDEIAAEAGFPHFIDELKGHGEYFLYVDDDLNRVARFDPATGKQVGKPYTPKMLWRNAQEFHNPIEFPASTPGPGAFTGREIYYGKDRES